MIGFSKGFFIVISTLREEIGQVCLVQLTLHASTCMILIMYLHVSLVFGITSFHLICRRFFSLTITRTFSVILPFPEL